MIEQRRIPSFHLLKTPGDVGGLKAKTSHILYRLSAHLVLERIRCPIAIGKTMGYSMIKKSSRSKKEDHSKKKGHQKALNISLHHFPPALDKPIGVLPFNLRTCMGHIHSPSF